MTMKTNQQTNSATWIRVPRPGSRCSVTQLSRSTIYQLITPCAANGFKPPVASHVVKASRYAKRGTRLIDRESLLAYIQASDGLSGSNATLNPSEKA
jgi:hypothetical protein